MHKEKLTKPIHFNKQIRLHPVGGPIQRLALTVRRVQCTNKQKIFHNVRYPTGGPIQCQASICSVCNICKINYLRPHQLAALYNAKPRLSSGCGSQEKLGLQFHHANSRMLSNTLKQTCPPELCLQHPRRDALRLGHSGSELVGVHDPLHFLNTEVLLCFPERS